MKEQFPDGRDLDQWFEEEAQRQYRPVRRHLAKPAIVPAVEATDVEETKRRSVLAGALRKYMDVFGIGPEQIVTIQRHNCHPINVTIGSLLKRVKPPREVGCNQP